MFAVVALVAATAAFAASNGSQASDTLVFGAEGDPVLLDGALVSDGESLRADRPDLSRRLVGLKPGTTKVVPALATSWTTSKNGLAWTFKLRKGVKFHDGTTVRREGRLLQLQPLVQPARRPAGRVARTTTGSRLRRLREAGDREPRPGQEPLQGLQGRERVDRADHPQPPLVVVPRRPRAADFGIASPTALVEVQGRCRQRSASDGVVPADRHVRAPQHPVGTGAVQVRVVEDRRQAGARRATTSYWGTKAKLKRVIIRPIADSTARLQALQSGELDGVEPARAAGRPVGREATRA